jgi:hypothetical protein
VSEISLGDKVKILSGSPDQERLVGTESIVDYIFRNEVGVEADPYSFFLQGEVELIETKDQMMLKRCHHKQAERQEVE